MKFRIRKADQLFSLYIRNRAGWKCERCHTQYDVGSQGLHCSHFHGRRKESVRFDPDNANAHCFSCHMYLGSNPYHFTEWKRKQLGDQRFDALLVRANTYQKKDDAAVILWCKEALKEFE